MLKKIAEMMIIAAVVLAAGAVFFRVVGAIPVSITQTQKQSTFDVTGEGKVAVKPDQAEMTLGVHKESANVKSATEEVDLAMKNLSTELKKLGIDEKDIKTTDYSVYPNYNFDNRKPSGYNVNSSVRVTIKDLEKASEVVDLIGTLGLEQSGGLNFTLSDSLKEKTMKEAREIAVNQAKKKAEELAGIAGMNLGRIINVQEGYSAAPRPYLMSAEMAKDAGSAAPAQIEPGTNETSVTVTLSYETR